MPKTLMHPRPLCNNNLSNLTQWEISHSFVSMPEIDFETLWLLSISKFYLQLQTGAQKTLITNFIKKNRKP